VAANAKIWIDHVRTELKIEPLVYTNPGLWFGRGAPELATQQLWLAHYTPACPAIPAPWLRWKIWQFTDTGRVDGIDGFVDLDVLDGTMSAAR
ncbi:MAG TPA: GH25 family lysozyme, partial [Kofleriaceae bacterium]|nr:GH25 family lysozyme [Kofleriaceae bacterium]